MFGVKMIMPIDYEFTPVNAKPARKYRKGSKYDAILEAFKATSRKLVKLEVAGKDGNYIRTRLSKLLTHEEYAGIKASVINGECYLEK